MGDATTSYRDFGPGVCNGCGQPMYWPQFQRPGFEGCQCATPDLETWAQYDAACAAEDAAKQAPAIEPGTILPIQTRGLFWKKRAKRL